MDMPNSFITFYSYLFNPSLDSEHSDEEDEKEVEKNENRKSKETLSLSDLCDDPDVQSDAKFVDECQALFQKHQTSKLFTPFMSQMKFIHNKARRSVKKRIDQKLKVRYIQYFWYKLDV